MLNNFWGCVVEPFWGILTLGVAQTSQTGKVMWYSLCERAVMAPLFIIFTIFIMSE
jgi:hypothetical protein